MEIESIKKDVEMSWESVKLGSLIEVLSGFAFDSAKFNGSIGTPLIRIRDIKRSYTETLYNGEFDQKYLIRNGDVLIGMDGEFNVAEWTGKDALLNQRVCKIEIKDPKSIYLRYLLYYLPFELKLIEDKASFVTVKHLSVSDIKNIQIPLPPLATQKRIAEILDAADALRRKDQELLKKYDELAQAIFIDMFGDPVKNEKGWEVKSLDEVCSNIFGGGTPTKSNNQYYNGSIPWVTPKDMKSDIISDSIDHITEEAVRKSSTKLVPPNSVLMVIRSGILKHTLPVAINDKSVSMNQDMKAFIPNTAITNSIFLKYFFHAVSSFLLKKVRAVTADNIEFDQIKYMDFICPPISMQEDFSIMVTNLQKQVVKQKDVSKKNDTLFNSLIQKAFKGELVA